MSCVRVNLVHWRRLAYAIGEIIPGQPVDGRIKCISMHVNPAPLSQNLVSSQFAGNFQGDWNVYLASG